MKIAIIGGGFTGLTAALRLAKEGHLVTLFEKEDQLGGLASSFKKNGWDWPLEHYFHHYFSSDQAVKRLVQELHLEKKLSYFKPKTSVYLEGKVSRFDSFSSLLFFPKLKLTDKLRTGLTILFLKFNPFWQPLEKIPAATFIQKTMGKETYRLIWQPLLQSKFGALANQIPASWFWTRIKKRSFALGYLNGGTAALLSALTEEIKKKQGQILLGQAVSQIKKAPDGFVLYFQSQPYPTKFEKVMATVPPATLAKIASELPLTEKASLQALKSLGSLCLILALKKSLLTDGTYWLNVNESHFPFVAVVEHTNLIDKKHYGQNVLLYIGGYYPAQHPFFRQNKAALFRKFLPYLQKINPSFDFNQNLNEYWLFKNEYSQPIVSANYSQNRPLVKTSLPGLYWASLHHIYPEDRGVNSAILLGEKLANEIVS
ncbi:MAG TPA: NAD(P)/FAD-dependent oxidoreductase [Patescibacteria group bacterium]|nr:NAD(P)/FAD-dependent oxidoreductase [Patescibacteria group bacterium]